MQDMKEATLRHANWQGDKPGLDGKPLTLIFNRPVFDIGDWITHDLRDGQPLRVISKSGATVVCKIAATDIKTTWLQQIYLEPGTQFFFVINAKDIKLNVS